MNEQTLGANIRQRREGAGITVTELARRAGLTKSTVSKIETGKASPPIGTILRIAQALAAPLAELFSEPEAALPFTLTRAGEGHIITRDGTRFGYSYEGLALDMKRKAAEPFLLTIRPGDPQGMFKHGGQEFIYMLSGQIEFCVGKQKMRLGRGDALYFDPSQPHSTRIIGKKPARFLCVFVLGNGELRTGREGGPARKNRRKP